MIDQLEAIESKAKPEEGEIDLCPAHRRLRAEREQGITIDVAYKYFSTPKRNYHPDAPGHVQYTRNMVTAPPIQPCDHTGGCPQWRSRANPPHSIITSLLNLPT